ncbi:MAG: c-type cytochrome [Armatimonadetes bacterium]|nr:c-type cytochrome [Armatimonadota bacterium]
MPPQASEWAFHYDLLFWGTSALAVFFTLVVGILVTVLAIKYRAGSKADRRNPIDHSNLLEMSWSLPPLVLAIGMFFWSATDFIQYRKMPEKASEIFVIGKQWMWHLQHMNGIRENNELHCVVGQPVKMTMISQDVIHAMYLPDFRAQFHVVPGRYTELTFTPTMTGKFRMLCAMHCGTQHSEMVGQVIVMSPKDYADWLAKDGNRFTPTALSMADAGKRLFTEKGCGNCHGGVDTERAPTLVGLFGKQRDFDNGEKVVADNEYVRESIVNPWRLINKGYTNTMPAYKGQITEEQVLDLMAYIKSISGSAANAPAEAAGRKPEGSIPGFAGPQNSTDAANRVESAGAAQFKQSENRP